MVKRTIRQRIDDLKNSVYELPAGEPLLDSLIELVCIVSKMREEQSELLEAAIAKTKSRTD